MANRRGNLMAADTTCPDTGIWVFVTMENAPPPARLSASRVGNGGTHGSNGHCPCGDGPVSVDTPQHTHPHPRFAPDDSVVLFTSGRSGFAPLCECDFSPAA